MKPFFASIIIPLLAVTHSIAQQKVGFEAGFINSNYAGKPNNYEGKPVPGFKAGFAFNNRLSDDAYLQAGLVYLRNGYTQTYNSSKKTVSVQTVMIPIYLQFPFAKNKGYGMSFGIGPYVARNLNASIKFEGAGQYNSLYPTASTLGDGINHTDFGMGADFLYETKFGMYVRAHGQLGLRGISNDQIINNRNFGIAIGYMIDVSPPKASESKRTHSKHHSGKGNTRSKH